MITATSSQSVVLRAGFRDDVTGAVLGRELGAAGIGTSGGSAEAMRWLSNPPDTFERLLGAAAAKIGDDERRIDADRVVDSPRRSMGGGGRRGHRST